MKRNQKRLTILSFVIVLLFFSTSLNSVNIKAYEWDITQTVTLQEYDNVGYGVITGDHSMENQYLEAEYDTDLRYVRPGIGSAPATMGNDSKDFRASFVSTYYQTNDQFVLEDDKWQNFPTYLQAFNNTGYGPNLNITVGLKTQGELSLKQSTALELEPEMIYKYTVSLKAEDLYDLNIKTTDTLTYYIYFNGVLSQSKSINGITRQVSLLQSRGKGVYEIYFYSTVDNYIIINPRDINIFDGKANTPISSHFINDPDNVWNETKNLFEENLNKETVHAIFYTLAPGDYQFKYIRFDNSIWSQAYVVLPTQYYDSSTKYSYLDFVLGSWTIEKFVMHFEYETQILVCIEGGIDNFDYLEFDYIFSIKNIDDLPLIEEGGQIHYQDDMLNFGINVNRTMMVYLNYSLPGTTGLWCIKQEDAGTIRGYNYNLKPYGEDAAKILLDPGYYFFMEPSIAAYDFLVDYRTIDYETFNTTSSSTSFNLEQENGEVSNYKLFKLEAPKFEFVNYNFSLVNNKNYTAHLTYKLYIGSYTSNVWTHSFYLANRQLDGVFEGFPKNNAQEMEYFSIRDNSVRYVLIYVNTLYNNTGWSDDDDYINPYVNQTTIQLNLKTDTGLPEAYDNANVHLIDANLSALGAGSYSTSFTDVVNNYEVYMFNATVRDLSWYKIRITMDNGTNYNHDYDLDNCGSVRPYRFDRVGIWNEYYYTHTGSSTYFASTEVNGSVVTYETEFGVYSPNLIFMFSVAHVGLNGTFHIEFIPYNCTEITAIDFGEDGGLSTGGIIALSVIGGLLLAGGITVLVIKVVVPKIKSKTPM